MFNKIKNWFQTNYKDLLGIEDTPYRKAMGLGVGVFLGNFPGMGPLSAIVAAHVFKLNRPAALIGSLITNFWLSILTLSVSVQIGSLLLGKDPSQIRESWDEVLKDFHWDHLTEGPFLNIAAAVLTGYLFVSLLIGVLVYTVVFLILTEKQKRAAKI